MREAMISISLISNHLFLFCFIDFLNSFKVIQHIMEWYRPGAVVLQCGADSLAGDKLGCFNLNMKGEL